MELEKIIVLLVLVLIIFCIFGYYVFVSPNGLKYQHPQPVIWIIYLLFLQYGLEKINVQQWDTWLNRSKYEISLVRECQRKINFQWSCCLRPDNSSSWKIWCHSIRQITSYMVFVCKGTTLTTNMIYQEIKHTGQNYLKYSKIIPHFLFVLFYPKRIYVVMNIRPLISIWNQNVHGHNP